MSEVTDPQSKRRTSGPGRLSSPGQDHRFQALLDSIPQLAWLADATGAAHWFNQRWYEFTGTSPDRGLRSGWVWVELIHPDHAKRVRARYRKCVGSGDSWEDTFPLRAADGSYSWFLSRAVPLVDENGELGGWLATSTDVSEQQEIEENRERLLVAERIARNEAERAREAAQSANKAKSEFLAMMSHEIRTPINAVIGYTQLLDVGVAGPITSGQREQLARIMASGKHLLALIDDILDLSRIDAGRLRVAQSHGVAGETADAALALVRPQALAKRISVSEECEGYREAVYAGDDRRVQQILINLLANAVKFTPPGGRVVLGCHVTQTVPFETDRRGSWTSFDIVDTGVGIRKEVQQQIFRPFVQGDTGYSRPHGGTGLGLSISQRLARLMGGEITLESEDGAGSRFTLWLPMDGEARSTAYEDSLDVPDGGDRGMDAGVGREER
jgi:PAS domain S-box-containing protein